MIYAVVGSRGFMDYNLLCTKLDELGKRFKITKIISGGAQGADQLAVQYAVEKNISFDEYLPDYKVLGKNATIARNKTMVEDAEVVVAFWDGSSLGTKSTIDYARRFEKKLEKELFVYEI
jgi:hypothetical protein